MMMGLGDGGCMIQSYTDLQTGNPGIPCVIDGVTMGPNGLDEPIIGGPAPCDPAVTAYGFKCGGPNVDGGVFYVRNPNRGSFQLGDTCDPRIMSAGFNCFIDSNSQAYYSPIGSLVPAYQLPNNQLPPAGSTTTVQQTISTLQPALQQSVPVTQQAVNNAPAPTASTGLDLTSLMSNPTVLLAGGALVLLLMLKK